MLDCSVVIPTFYPGDIINKLFLSLPAVKEIIVFDNGNDKKLKNETLDNFRNIKYINTGDIGLAKTFNFALNNTVSQNIFITQPDVELYNNCIENLLDAKKKYENAAILAPLVFEDNKYSIFDHYQLKIYKSKKLKKKIQSKKNNIIPSGDFCVEAIPATAMLIDRNKVINIGGWDNYYYTYLEDIDLSYNVRKNNYEIIKIFNSKVNHIGFGSHEKKNFRKINQKRIFNFTKSSLYFDRKYKDKFDFWSVALGKLIVFIIKFFLNLFLIRLNKVNLNFYRLKAYYYFFILEKLGKMGNKQ